MKTLRRTRGRHGRRRIQLSRRGSSMAPSRAGPSPVKEHQPGFSWPSLRDTQHPSGSSCGGGGGGGVPAVTSRAAVSESDSQGGRGDSRGRRIEFPSAASSLMHESEEPNLSSPLLRGAGWGGGNTCVRSTPCEMRFLCDEPPQVPVPQSPECLQSQNICFPLSKLYTRYIL